MSSSGERRMVTRINQPCGRSTHSSSITKAAREIVELVSEIAHNLTIPAFGEARQLGDETADKTKKFPLRWREFRSRRIRIFWDHDRIFGDCSTYLVQKHGLDGGHERIAVLHAGEDPLNKLETWCQLIQCAGGRMTASVKRPGQQPQAVELAT